MPSWARSGLALFLFVLPLEASAQGSGERESTPPGDTLRRDGREWVEIGHGIRFGVGNTVCDVSRGSPRLAFVGTDVGYIYRSVDGGATWDEIRLLPDDQPLLNVPLMNPSSIPFPNEGLVDPYSIDIPAGTFRWPDLGPTNLTYGPEAIAPTGTVSFPRMSHLRRNVSLESGVNAFALVGSGARVETEDPGNLMASFFSGVAAQPGRVNWLSICQSNPTIAFAATNFGAFRTSDLGITWDRVFIGSSEGENLVRSVHCHPEDDRIVLLATAEGMRVSRDGGESWDRPTGNLGSWTTNSIVTHPLDRRRILVGTEIGAYETMAGTDEITRYLADTPSPDVRSVWHVRGTSDERIWYVGTSDGAAYSHDGGRTWTRVSEFLLGHYPIYAVIVDPRDPLHAYFQTPYHLFESRDGGQTVEMILWGYTTLKYTMLDPSDPDVLWLVGYSQVWRYERPRRPRPGLTPAARRARAALARDPGQYEVMDRALRRAGLDAPTVQRIQRRMRRASLVPTLEVVAWMNYQQGDLRVVGVGRAASHSTFLSIPCWSHASVALCPFARPMDEIIVDGFTEPYYAGFVMLTWPLGRAVMDERQTGRVWLDVFAMQDMMMYNVYDYWADRRRALEYLAEGTATPDEEASYLLRLEETSAVLDGLTDGMVGGPFGEESEWRGTDG